MLYELCFIFNYNQISILYNYDAIMYYLLNIVRDILAQKPTIKSSHVVR